MDLTNCYLKASMHFWLNKMTVKFSKKPFKKLLNNFRLKGFITASNMEYVKINVI